MYKQDDIVVVKFPFTEATEFKKRPALASGSTTNDYYVYDAGGNVLAVYPEDDNATGVDNVEFPIYAASKVGTYYAEKNQTDGYDNSISYEVTDHLGNVRSLINKKEDVTTTQSFDYYAYGGYQPTRQLVNTPRYRHAYQGQFAEKDAETNTYHFDARDYDPKIGRWTTTDPAKQFWNSYFGMGNNPIVFVDSDGRWVTLAIAGVGAVIGAGTTALDIYSSGGKFDSKAYTRIGVAALAGGLAASGLGGLVGATSVNVIGNVVDQAIKNNLSSNIDDYSANEVGTSLLASVIGAKAGGKIGKNFYSPSSNAAVREFIEKGFNETIGSVIGYGASKFFNNASKYNPKPKGLPRVEVGEATPTHINNQPIKPKK